MSEDIHGLIDWCPICGMELDDDTQKSRWEHDKRYHPDYFTAQTRIKRNNFFSKEDLK